MQVIDITRVKDNDFESDFLVGKYSMDAKTKTIKYICDFALANYKLNIDKELLDSNLNMDMFSLKQFIKLNYNYDIKYDLIIQKVDATKDNCVFVKQYDINNDEYPIIYQFNKDELNKAKIYMAFLINDFLINKLSEENRIDEYEKLKLNLSTFKKMSYLYDTNKFEINTLYDKGIFLETLLNNDCSLNQLNTKEKFDLHI